ncbi:hypothetical protein [Clostridium thermarum]|uniref:hypothetical protein n=1 Tax=Clostridium thermarum TaxID=1716543 RepID=UPI0011218579|nr:hypothetical protein [Clostridium thermarum]
MKICPLCNAMYDTTFLCENCKEVLSDVGRIEDYLDPYSADMPIENSQYCRHIYKCNNCGKIENYNIKMVNY